MSYLQTGAILIGAVGLFAILSALTGLLSRLIPGKIESRISKRLGVRGESDKSWPVMARIGRSFSRLKRESYDSEEDLMDTLLRAGLPYTTPVHFYSRQILAALIFGAFGLVLGLLFSVLIEIPPMMVLGTALLLGFWGSTQPQAEVKKNLKIRAEDLILDMTYGLPRLILYLESMGEFQLAANRVLQTEEVTSLPQDESLKRQQAARMVSEEYALLLGATVIGFGGNLFADMLNRLASYLAQSIPVLEAVEMTRRFYPATPKLNQFLDIVSAGVAQEIPMKQRLEDMQITLREELKLHVKERAASAKQVVIIAAAAELLPLFLIVGAPTVYMAVQMFG